MGKLIQIFEHEKLTIHPDRWEQQLTANQLARLYDFNDRNGNIYFTGIRDGVKFNSFVGVIQIGGLTIEILPKTDKNTEQNKAEWQASTTSWRNVLLSMLASCNKIKLDAVSEANLHRRYNSILDLYFEIFLEEVTGLLKKGLIKNYKGNHANISTLKGRLDFGQNISKNLVHKDRFFTHHQIYTYDHLINQVLARALTILKQITNNLNVKEKLARVWLDFPEISDCVIQKHHFDKHQENRKTQSYTEALKIARMIILNYSPDIKSGSDNMLALLFDMNKLWEEYVFRQMFKYKPHDCRIIFQNSKVFWKTLSKEKTIRPDIVIEKAVNGQQQHFIIDAKWKIIDYLNPGDEDLKQMYAYNMYWNAGRCMLIYPKTENYTESWGEFPVGRTSENLCKLGFIDVFNTESKGLNRKIGEEIFQKLFDGQ
ncbi:MAG: McrC family protein [Bacteroidota bacterium]